VAYAAVAIALLSLTFTIASFWWIHARAGSLRAVAPNAYAFANRSRLRLPLAVFNSGTRDAVVGDLRIVVPDGSTMRWVTTRALLRPGSDDGFAFATPFAVRGRSTREIIAEFEGQHWEPDTGRCYRMALEARQDDGWHSIGAV
jgi:hypothetical protein